MNLNILGRIIFFIVIFYATVFAQFAEEQTVARVGNKVITKEEFLERYEFTPRLNNAGGSTSESAELDFLYTLIAEKLWAQESEALGSDTLEIMKFSKEEFEKMFVRDALYKKEITDKIKITDAELLTGYFRNETKLEVNFLFSEDKAEIDKLYKMLTGGVLFDSVLSARPEYEEQATPIEVVYGQMDAAVEDSLYKLNLGEYTTPIFTPDGWYIFRLTNKVESVLNTTADLEDSRSSVEKIIKARKSQELYRKFYADYFSDKKVNVNPVLFESFAEKISRRFKWKKKNSLVSDSNLINLLADDVLFIENQFGADSLKQNFIEFDEEPITLKKYIRMLAFDGFSASDYRITYIRALLDARTKYLIEQELLAREGIKRGYNLLPGVRAEINMWMDNYQFQILRNQFLDSVSVSDDEVYTYYKTRQKAESYPQLVNVIEILTDSLSTVNRILKAISEGADFRELAGKYTKRDWAKKNGGEFGLFPVTSHGEIGRIAATMNVGDIYGPLAVPGGYSIFKLIDKKDSTTIKPEPFEKVKDEYKRELAYRKLRVKMNNYTTNLAIKYGVSIDYDLLNSIEVTNINSFALRRLGFGGKITAVPMVAPNTEWVNPWLEKLKVLQ